MTDVIEEQSRKPKKPQTGNGGGDYHLSGVSKTSHSTFWRRGCKHS
jgi:hypothetical protein